MKLTPDQKAGLYITAIIHLAVIVVLLAVQIGFQVKKENTFVLDFSKQEEKERLEKQEELKISAAEKLEQMLAAAAMLQRGAEIRNVTVNRSPASSRTTAIRTRKSSTAMRKGWRRN